MKEFENKIAGTLILIFIVPAFMLKAYILYCVWGWFIVPLGVVKISVVHAFGLSVFWQIFTMSYKKTTETNVEFLIGLLSNVFGLIIGWGIAYIVYLMK